MARARSFFFCAAWLLGPMMPPPQLTRGPSLYMVCGRAGGGRRGEVVQGEGQRGRAWRRQRQGEVLRGERGSGEGPWRRQQQGQQRQTHHASS